MTVFAPLLGYLLLVVKLMRVVLLNLRFSCCSKITWCSLTVEFCGGGQQYLHNH